MAARDFGVNANKWRGGSQAKIESISGWPILAWKKHQEVRKAVVLGGHHDDHASRGRLPEGDDGAPGKEGLDLRPARLGIAYAEAGGPHEEALGLSVDEFVVRDDIRAGAEEHSGDRVNEAGLVRAIDEEDVLKGSLGCAHRKGLSERPWRVKRARELRWNFHSAGLS